MSSQQQQRVKEITVTELKRRMDAGEEIFLLDVREPHELRICCLSNTFHIPLGDLPDRLPELDSCKDQELIVYCRSGRRSEMACRYLLEQCFTNVKNLTGGILAWSDQVDPNVKKY